MSSREAVLHGGNPWAWSKLQGSPAQEILDFSVDLNPLGPPADLADLLQEGAGSLRRYPEPTYERFRKAVGRRLERDPAQILPGNGTSELIHLVSRAFARARAAVVVPTFTEYERAVAADGGQTIPIPLREEEAFAPPALKGGPDLSRIQLLFLCNPNNPTGTFWPKELIFPWIQAAQLVGAMVIVDEAYMDLTQEPAQGSLAREIERFPNLIILRSLTKTFAVPGLRAGYLVASALVCGRLGRLAPPWSMNALASWVMLNWLNDEEYLARSRRAIAIGRRQLEKGLKAFPQLAVFPSQANFLLIRLEDSSWSGPLLRERLLSRGILIRACDDFTGLAPGRFIRVAVRAEEENQRLLLGLRELLL